MRAFTLVETLVTIALTVVVWLAIAVTIQFFYKTNEFTFEQTKAVDSARGGVDQAMVALREASYGSDGSYPVATASSTSITFYSDLDNDGTAEKVTYYLATTTSYQSTLYQLVVNPAGNPLSYAGQPASTSTIATYVINGTTTPVFTYYDSTGAQLAYPITIGQIASVNTTVIVDLNANRAPASFTLSSGATLRNLRAEQ